MNLATPEPVIPPKIRNVTADEKVIMPTALYTLDGFQDGRILVPALEEGITRNGNGEVVKVQDYLGRVRVGLQGLLIKLGYSLVIPSHFHQNVKEGFSNFDSAYCSWVYPKNITRAEVIIALNALQQSLGAMELALKQQPLEPNIAHFITQVRAGLSNNSTFCGYLGDDFLEKIGILDANDALKRSDGY